MSDEVEPFIQIGPVVIGKVVKGEKPATPTDEQINATDVAIVMDATSSMAPYIQEARRQARAAADAVIAAGDCDARFVLVGYRDHPPEERSWVTQSWSCPGTQELQGALDSLQAQGGGDRPEAVWDGVFVALAWLQWRPGSARLLYLIGDSPPHGHDAVQSHDGFPQGCPCGLTHEKLVARLKELNVAVHAVSIAGCADTTAAFKLLSDATGGTCVEAQRPEQVIGRYTDVLAGYSHSNKVGKLAAGHFGGEEAAWTAPAMASFAADNSLKVEDVAKAKVELVARGLVRPEDTPK